MPSDIISLTEFKAHASEWVERLQHQPPIVLTQNGKGRVVVESYEAYQQAQDALAMMQIVARGEADVRAGRTTPHKQVFAELRRDLAAREEQVENG
ncbi:MAG: type II toxin-antitoxin system Phd/YefM family antitoxin [Sinobacteraceae bacterium]|nr:type II toxin-antitoxin system Phd/YefM family antitoxin [Nevskiaceae bacterium]